MDFSKISQIVLPPDYYDLNYTYNDSSDLHPNGVAYQSIIENGRRLGAVGIAINALETGLFFEKLLKGEVISPASLDQMTDCFVLPDGWWDLTYHTMQAGYGIEKFLTPYGNAYGHTGDIMGFNSLVQYFPDSDKTFVMIVNSSSYEHATQESIYNSCMEIMFNEW